MPEKSSTLAPVAMPLPAQAAYLDAVVAALAGRRLALDGALRALPLCAPMIAAAAARLVETLQQGGKALAAGNGGSAAEANHFVAELVGRFQRERAPYAAIALTSDMATLTAVANDYGYADVFARQVCALGRPGDVLMLFSTSGESENILRAAQAGRRQDMTVVALTGERLSSLQRLADLTIRVPSAETPLIQELHMLLTHVLCDLVEGELASREKGAHV